MLALCRLSADIGQMLTDEWQMEIDYAGADEAEQCRRVGEKLHNAEDF